MATLTLIQVASYACQAGFHGSSLYTIMSIAQFESSFNTQAVNAQDAHGGSYGILQINGSHFGEQFPSGSHQIIMSKEVAFDPQEAFNFAWWLSQHGTKFTDWSTWARASAPIIKQQMAYQLKDSVIQLACQINQ